ncbi:GNAT family N-acetyltransferase [Fluviibacterium sp. DFM31]|uniref:GNAT family N-acetyltransferase n=1 Tax=Meridianimarinicoccus marinus TaxID=3231483 RepID=A0ABV3L1W7_9RHOB
MSPTIRPVRPEDRTRWQALWTGYLDFYDTTLPAEQFDRQFARLTAPAPEIHGLVAEQDGELLGLVHFLFHAHGWKATDVCYLQDLYTAPAQRGTGIGRALIEAVYATADARGAPDVYWLTQTFNAPARQLYDRIGTATPFMVYRRS